MGETEKNGSESGKAGKTNGRSRWSKSAMLATAALLLVLPVVLFAWYALVGWEQLNHHHQRQLARSADLLETRVRSARANVKNASGHNLADFVERQPYLVFVDPTSELVKVDIEQILLEAPRPDAFEHVFLVTDKGKVYQTFPRDRWTDESGWSMQRPGPVEKPTPELRIADLVQGLASSELEMDSETFRAATGQYSVTLGGERFQLYTQPVRMGLTAKGRLEDNDDEVHEWTLAALSPYKELQQRSFAFETYFVAGLTLLTIVTILGWPFVKIWTLDPGERFRYGDVILLYLSTSALTALLTMLTLAGDSYRDFSEQGNQRLQDMAKKINDNLQAELKNTLAQVDEFDREYGDDLCEMRCHLLDANGRDEDETCNQRACRSLPSPTVFKNVSQVAWLSADGFQVNKASVGVPFKLLDVSKRRYFQGVDRDEMFTLEGAERRFFARPDRSITTGQFYTFLSAESRKGPKAIAFSMQLASLSEQPLHPGYGFAVVDRSGTVLYHSDTRLPLRENLFAEVSEPLKLQAAMLAGLERELTLSYYARPHRFYVDPMDYLQGELAPTWTLVTFRDLSIGRSAAVQALTLAILWPLPLLVLLGGIALYVFSNLKIPHRGAWLWPQESKRSRYIWISLWLAVSALASQSWDTASWGLLIVALVTAVPIYAAMRRVPDSDRQPLQSIAWHRVFLLLVVFQLAVIPARGVFRVIWSDQMGKLYAYEQGTLAARKADFRRSAIEGFHGDPPLSVLCCSVLVQGFLPNLLNTRCFVLY